jgi:hypothetical protein
VGTRGSRRCRCDAPPLFLLAMKTTVAPPPPPSSHSSPSPTLRYGTPRVIHDNCAPHMSAHVAGATDLLHARIRPRALYPRVIHDNCVPHMSAPHTRREVAGLTLLTRRRTQLFFLPLYLVNLVHTLTLLRLRGQVCVRARAFSFG